MRRALFALLLAVALLGQAFSHITASPNEGSLLTHGSGGSYDLSWQGILGRTYFVQHSEDLMSWIYFDDVIEAGGGALGYGFTVTGPDRFFLRLRYTDVPNTNRYTADSDGDGISNWDELQQFTDPLSTPDIDGNGIPDDWERFYFGQIGIDPDAPSPGDASMTNAQKSALHLNPNVTDTDGDGVADSADNYPHDPKRSDDIPVTTYAVIDLSGEVQGTDPVWAAALDDSGQAGFSFHDSADASHRYTWKDGTRTALSTVPPTDTAPDGSSRDLSPDVINAAGMLVGTWGSRSGVFSVEGGPVTVYDNTYAITADGLSENGLIVGTYAPEFIAGAAGPLANPTIFNDNFFPSAISDIGVVAGSFDSYYSPSHAALWTDGMTAATDLGSLLGTSGDSHSFDVNDSQQVVGISDAPADPDTANPRSAFVFTNGVMTPMRDVTPAVFKRQLDFSATDFARISNSGKVLINGKTLEGSEDGVAWKAGTFVSDKDSSGTARIHRVQVPADWTVDFKSINSSGLILALARKQATDAQGNPATNPDGSPEYEQLRRAVLLLPVELAVDANRDGVVKFAGNFNDSSTQGKPKDTTSETKPFRFWLNDDNDQGDEDHPGSSTKDFDDGSINSRRDIEDFTRLNIYLGGLHEAVTQGTIKIGLKWKNTSGTSPSVKVWRNLSPNGGIEYLTDDTVAQQHLALTDPGHVQGTSAYIIPTQFWVDAGFSATQPNGYLLFEAGTEGKGQLVMTIHKADGSEIGEGPGVWLHLLNIKRMYDRGKAQPDPDYPAPYNYDASNDPPPHPPVSFVPDPYNFPFEKPSDETKQCIVYVHGFDTNYATYQSRAQTTFKRLWWRGYKGRFCSFRWPTLEIMTANGYVNFDANYNEGEYRAWKYGPALKAYVESLPGDYEKNLAAHSLGNVVVGSALKGGMVITNYTLMNAAISAGCYDVNPALDHADFVTKDAQHPTPDLAVDLGYRGYLTNVQGNISNFYNPEDILLKAWDVNNRDLKPVGYGLSGPWYDYFPSEPANWRRKLTFFWTVGRKINDPEESMPFIARSRTVAVGRQGATGGAITIGNGRNVNAAPHSFGNEHSAPWERRVQQLKAYYDELLISFNLTPNQE